MHLSLSPTSDAWARHALEQARIIVMHLERGGRDSAFLRTHALTLAQSIDGAERRGVALIIRRLN
jgi:hypothetical protein